MRALEPAGSSMGSLETSGRLEHASGVAPPHHSQVAEYVGETAPARTGSLRPGKRPMRHFANEGNNAFAETAQGFKGDGAESVTWTIVSWRYSCNLSWSRLRAALPACWAERRA
jgi:hypothetical protein